MRYRRALRTLVAVALTAACLSVGHAASADEDHVPAANDDAITLWAGSTDVLIDVLANDTDLDGHRDLAICRFSPPWPTQGVMVQQEDIEGPGMLEIEVETGASGDFTFEYQACDYSYIVPATLTVTVQPVAATTVTRDPDHPRKLLFTNPDQHAVWVFWGPVHSEIPNGYVELAPGESTVVTAGSRRVEWFAGFEDNGIEVYTGYGRIGGLTTRPSSRAPVVDDNPDVDPTTVPPPVTGDEEVTRWAGSMGYVDVLANDSDPQGQPLDICRVAPSGRDVTGFVEAWNGRFRLDTRENRSGTYTVTYYACNQSRLAPGTVTVHLRQARPVEIATTNRAGVLRIANRNPDQVSVRFLDDFHPEHTRTVRLPAESVRRVRVDPALTRWYAVIGNMRGYAGDGFLHST